LIKFLLKLASDNNSIILDFFAGSGTTAHAVMDFNAEDGGRDNAWKEERIKALGSEKLFNRYYNLEL
jgi:adenine specific DNA methylase Mod